MMPQYPISISADGGLSISSDPDVDNVLALIDTRYFERCMFPNYGVAIEEFDTVSSQGLGLFLATLKLSLELWHDFVTEVSVDSEQLENGLLGLRLEIQNRTEPIEVNL